MTAIAFDLSAPETIAAAAEQASETTLLVNSAATAAFTMPQETE